MILKDLSSRFQSHTIDIYFCIFNFLSTESEKGIFQLILQGKLDLQSEPWPSISDSAKDLIQKMLDRDPKKRLTAREVLCKSLSLAQCKSTCFSFII